jgi:hypothetical protein
MFDFLAIAWVVSLTPPAIVQHAAVPAPTTDLLEFLGEWGDDRGGVIDPTSLASKTPPSTGHGCTTGTADSPTATTPGNFINAPLAH